ncbi:MAG: hypothetical protein KIH63_000250 [Candidatus Saccharibacteria bacterium]|nr:hypothetical protein [Candidatus Saccharibacteria bacterium]
MTIESDRQAHATPAEVPLNPGDFDMGTSGPALHSTVDIVVPSGRSSTVAAALMKGLEVYSNVSGGLVTADPTRAEEILGVYENLGLIGQTDTAYPVGVNVSQRLAQHTTWPGTISLDARIAAGELSHEDVVARVELMSRLYVPASEGAPIRCPDPRFLKNFNGFDFAHVMRPIGPQVIAGTLGAAIARRLGEGAENWDNITLRDDVEELSDIEERTGYKPGDHIHEDAKAGEMGCKGVDSARQNLANLHDVALSEDLNSLTRSIIGQSGYHGRTMSLLRGHAIEMSAHADTYLTDQAALVEQLKGRYDNSLEVLAGPNNAAIVAINYVPRTTFHRDLYNYMTGNDMQVVNYDYWRSIGVATDLATNRSGQVDGEARRSFLHARVAYTVGTLMSMIDGSQFAVERVPNDFHTARSL